VTGPLSVERDQSDPYVAVEEIEDRTVMAAEHTVMARRLQRPVTGGTVVVPGHRASAVRGGLADPVRHPRRRPTEDHSSSAESEPAVLTPEWSRIPSGSECVTGAVVPARHYSPRPVPPDSPVLESVGPDEPALRVVASRMPSVSGASRRLALQAVVVWTLLSGVSVTGTIWLVRILLFG